MTQRSVGIFLRRRWWLGLAIGWLALHLLPGKPFREPYMIAHRGAAGLAPENTATGVRTAAELGANYTEIDVQRTADGALVVMHDATVDRTTNGSGAVAEMTFAELSTLTVEGEPIPTLHDILVEAADTSTGVIIEVKNPDRFPGIRFDVADVLADTSTEYGIPPIIVSFDHKWLRDMQAAYPGVATGQIWGWVPPGGPYMGGAQTVSVHWLGVLVDPTLVWRLHRQGYEVVAWTVDAPWLIRWLIRRGVDGIATNRPDLWPF